MLFLSIPKPCHENWDEMSSREQGAFCKVCAKTVIDFTSLSDDEVKNYFLRNRNQKTCGRFRDDQLTEPKSLPELLSRPIPFWKKFLAIVFILFGTFLSGCNNEIKNKPGRQDLAESEQLRMTVGVTLSEIKMDTTFLEKTVFTSVGTPAIIDEDIVCPSPLVGDVDIQIIEEQEIKRDTSFLVGEIIEETPKRIDPVIAKVDSVKKIINPTVCDTIPLKSIEP
jgi:hypothetical protein